MDPRPGGPGPARRAEISRGPPGGVPARPPGRAGRPGAPGGRNPGKSPIFGLFRISCVPHSKPGKWPFSGFFRDFPEKPLLLANDLGPLGGYPPWDPKSGVLAKSGGKCQIRLGGPQILGGPPLGGPPGGAGKSVHFRGYLITPPVGTDARVFFLPRCWDTSLRHPTMGLASLIGSGRDR